MNPDRLRACGAAISLGGFDRSGQAIERAQCWIERRSHGCRAIAGHAVRGDERLHFRKLAAAGLHDVVPRGAVDVDVNEPGRQDVLAVVEHVSAGRCFDRGLRPDACDPPIFHEHDCVGDFLQRREQARGGQGEEHRVRL